MEKLKNDTACGKTHKELLIEGLALASARIKGLEKCIWIASREIDALLKELIQDEKE